MALLVNFWMLSLLALEYIVATLEEIPAEHASIYPQHWYAVRLDRPMKSSIAMPLLAALRGGKADVEPDDDMIDGDPMMMQDDAAVYRAMKMAEQGMTPEEIRAASQAQIKKIRELAKDGKIEVDVGSGCTIPFYGTNAALPCMVHLGERTCT
jgi:hypothetical protein